MTRPLPLLTEDAALVAAPDDVMAPDPGDQGEWSPGLEGRRHGVAFSTVGCRLNQAETEEALDDLVRAGLRLRRGGDADLVVVNTCTVTRESTATSRKLVRRAVDNNPDAFVVVTGCYATSDPDEAAAIEGVDLVVDNTDKERLAELVFEAEPALAPTPAERLVGADADDATRRLHTRVSIRTQTGCDEHCAFCIIPSTRGPLRSRPGDEVIEDIRARVADGVREAVLTGVHLGKYGADTDDEEGLACLVERILDEVPGLERLRLSSVLPAQVTSRLIDVMAATDRVCNHLHVPLQSGSDTILAAMGRSYDVALFLDRVGEAQGRLADLGLSTDVIVGFPGEADEDFAGTLRVVEQVGFSKLHVFRYSPRPGTRSAETMRDSVPSQVKKHRSRELIALGERLRDAFHTRLLGRELVVIAEVDRGDGSLQGTADNYVKVGFRGGPELLEQRLRVRLTGLRGAATVGELVADQEDR